MKDLDIIPECYIDTNLIETILNTKGCYTEGVNHQKGCNTVVKTMNDPKKLKNEFALGIVDADKRQPSYVEACAVIARTYGYLYTILRTRSKHPIRRIRIDLRPKIIYTNNKRSRI